MSLFFCLFLLLLIGCSDLLLINSNGGDVNSNLDITMISGTDAEYNITDYPGEDYTVDIS